MSRTDVTGDHIDKGRTASECPPSFLYVVLADVGNVVLADVGRVNVLVEATSAVKACRERGSARPAKVRISGGIVAIRIWSRDHISGVGPDGFHRVTDRRNHDVVAEERHRPS